MDPYSFERVTYADAFNEFNDIIEFKRQHPENVTLLLGNHDLGYLSPDICEVRHDFERAALYRKLILDNVALFDLVALEQFDDTEMLFSHAGIRTAWLRHNDWLFDVKDFRPESLNEMFHDEDARDDLFIALADVTHYRGGLAAAGSVVWADAMEFVYGNDELPGYVQIFGHTLHRGGAWCIDDNLWCLDCARAFTLKLTEDESQIHIF